MAHFCELEEHQTADQTTEVWVREEGRGDSEVDRPSASVS